MQKRLRVEIAVERTRNPVLFEIGLARNEVSADLIRFEDRSKAVVVELSERVVFMVVTLRTIEGQTEHCF